MSILQRTHCRNLEKLMRILRYFIQLLALIFFLGFFIFPISAYIFRFDPLIAITSSITLREINLLFWPALIITILTLILGRFFCGWLCPLGTLLDIFHFLKQKIPYISLKKIKKISPAKYFILSIILIAALFGWQWAGFFNPFSILYQGIISFITPTKLALFFTVILFFIFALEFLERRFWCRYLCPSGALMGLFARFSFLQRIPNKIYPNCGDCMNKCRMDAFDDEGHFVHESCILCFDCTRSCPKQAVKFKWKKPPSIQFNSSRRLFFASLISGVAVPTIAHAFNKTKEPLLRPPGAVPEKDFLDRCIRCGACIKTCPNKCLQPSLLENGIDSAFTPQFVPSLAPCKYDCNACTQVCPTHAIQPLSLSEKQNYIIGKAHVDNEKCLTYQGQDCRECVKVCPVGAIQVHRGHPRVIRSKCIGCGACENICPVKDKPAIQVTVPKCKTL